MRRNDKGLAWTGDRPNDANVVAGKSRRQDSFSRADIYQER